MRYGIMGGAVLALLVGLAPAAMAGTVISTEAVFDDPVGTNQAYDSDSGPPPSSISSRVEDPNDYSSTLFGALPDLGGPPDPAFAQANLTTDGWGAVRASGDFANPGATDYPYLKASAIYQETVTNSTGTAQAFTYRFSVFDVLLGIADYTGGRTSTRPSRRSTPRPRP
jgi:hypothetical protein